MSVARHLAGELFGGGEVVAAVNGAGRLGFRVADVNEPNGDFVAFVVLVGLGAVEEYAAPSAGNVVGHCREVRVVGVKPGDGDAGGGFGVHPVGECVGVSVHGEFLSMMGTQELALIHIEVESEETDLPPGLDLHRLETNLNGLITHRIKPEELGMAYEGLLKNKEQFLCAVMRWK